MAAVLEEHELGAADVGGELLGARLVPRAGAANAMYSVPAASTEG